MSFVPFEPGVEMTYYQPSTHDITSWRRIADDELPNPLTRRDHPHRHAQMAVSLGLEQHFQDFIMDPELAGRYFSRVFSDEEFDAWYEYADSTYSFTEGGWPDFEGEPLPAKVLEELYIAVQLAVFDDVMIYEVDGGGYLALGEVFLDPDGEHVRAFPIVRWGRNQLPEAQILEEFGSHDEWAEEEDHAESADSDWRYTPPTYDWQQPAVPTRASGAQDADRRNPVRSAALILLLILLPILGYLVASGVILPG